MSETVLELDERRRVSLGKIGRPEHRRYLVEEEPDGTLVLRPAIVTSEHEARFLANHQLVERVQANRQDPTRLVQRKRSSITAEPSAELHP